MPLMTRFIDNLSGMKACHVRTIDFPVSQVSLFSAVLLSLSRVRPDFDGTREDQCSLSASSHLPDGRLSPVSPAPPRSSSPIDSEWSEESFHSAADSPAIRTHVPDPGPVMASSLFCEGPFDAAAHHPRIGDPHGGCPYQVTSNRDCERYNMDGPFGLLVHHPQFLEWVGAPELACLLGRAPGKWILSLTRVQTLDAARQLQHGANLMTSNLSVLQQYALSLHGAVSDIFQLIVGRHCFPSTAVNDAAPVPRVRHASTHMAATGLWRPQNGSGGPGLDLFHQGPQCSGCPACFPCTSS